MKKNTIQALLNAGVFFLLGCHIAVSGGSAVGAGGRPESSGIPAPKWFGDVHEMVLVDGTKLAGTITSQTANSISIATSEGATITIPVRQIKSFDGSPYTSSAIFVNGGGTKNGERESTGMQFSPAGHGGGDSAKVLQGNSMIKPGESVNDLVAALQSAEWEKRSSAARELGVRGQWEGGAIEELSALLGDTLIGSSFRTSPAADSSVKTRLLPPGFEAARALAAMESRGYDELAHQMFSANPLVRQRAAFGLGETNNRLCVPILLKALKDRDPQVRAAAAGALHFPEATPQLFKAAEDTDEQVRAAAVAVLGLIGEATSEKVLIAALGDVNPSVRSAAAGALGKIKSLATVSALAKAIADPESDVRFSAVVALGKIRDTSTVTPLIAALKDRDGTVVKASAAALGDLRDPRAISPLRSALQTCPESARGAVGLTLKLLTEIPLLIGALDDRDTLVRRNAEYLLWLGTGKKLGYDKKAWADWFVSRNDSAGIKNPMAGISDTIAAPVTK